MRIARFILKLHYIANPSKFVVFNLCGVDIIALLILPMRRNTVFGNLVHFNSANLYFKRRAVSRKHRSMQRLIKICLRHGYIIFKSTGERFPLSMYCAKHGVTVFDIIYYDAQRNQIINLLKRLSFVKFSINTVKMLRSSVHVASYPEFVEHIVQLSGYIIYEFLPFQLGLRNLFGNKIITVRI